MLLLPWDEMHITFGAFSESASTGKPRRRRHGRAAIRKGRIFQPINCCSGSWVRLKWLLTDYRAAGAASTATASLMNSPLDLPPSSTQHIPPRDLPSSPPPRYPSYTHTHAHDSTSPLTHTLPACGYGLLYLDPARGTGSLYEKTVPIEKALGDPKILRFFPGMGAFTEEG